MRSRNWTIVGFTLAAMLAETQARAQKAPQPSALSAKVAVSNMFATHDACVSALGVVPYYEPLYLGGAKKNPVNGKTRVAAPLEGDACLHMVTMRGRQWVPIKSGTILRWNVGADGTKVPYAHDKCGNAVDGIVYPPSPIPPTRDSPKPIEVPVVSAPVPQVVTQPVALKAQVELLGPLLVRHEFGPLRVVPNDDENVVRSRGHGKAYAVGAVALGVGIGLVVANNVNPKNSSPKGKGPGVVTDSVTSGKCIATSYPNNCPPGGNRVPLWMGARAIAQNLQPNIDVVNRRVGIGGSIAFGKR